MGYFNPKYFLDENDEDIFKRSRRRIKTKFDITTRKAPRKFGGMGGHLTSALLAEMKLYDEMMRRAEREKLDNYKGMKANRAHYMKKHQERLQDRGYYGPWPVTV